ncbi:diacylglycerol kinase [Nitrosophilus kaiyonis]|uniref:diacylglycerol kinase n=1 Tax=Nitrosophilus kaiyonis TaxID=2930200 RepID=UPI002493C989|nr:diacylglycerol kinase [Nitrosophilus kaiyonis]
MINKPKYSLFKNAKYAIDGLIEAFKNEVSFKIEIVFFTILTIVIWFLPISLLSKTILQTSIFIPLIVELINSAIERVVDLVTKDFHPLAKYAKDAGAAAVLLSLFLTLGIWIAVFIYEFF